MAKSSKMFEMRPFLYRGGFAAGPEVPVAFNVFNRDGKEVAMIQRDGHKWFVSYGEARFNSPDEALASLELSPTAKPTN